LTKDFNGPATQKIILDPIWAASAIETCWNGAIVNLSQHSLKEINMDLLAFAKNIADRVEAQSARAKVPVAVCVMDIHGNIILKHRMSGAPAFSIEISERKAYTSALVGLRTADLSALVQPGQELFSLMGLSGGRFCSMPGGAPLTSDGQVVAGVGVSGGTVEQDVSILEAALPVTPALAAAS
jgi:uncharacterized protein GlcG (DUF336 family)